MDEKATISNDVQHMEEKNQAELQALQNSKDVKNTKVISVALADAVAKDNPPTWSWSMFQLYGIMILVTMSRSPSFLLLPHPLLTGSSDDCMNGYDGSVMSSLNAMKPFHNFFNVGMEGSSIGLVFSIYTVGSTIGALFAAIASDKFGRRFGMFVGSCLIIFGTIIEVTAHALGQFMAGRFFVGFGVTIAVTAAPVYLVEMAFPTCGGLREDCTMSWDIMLALLV